MHVICDPRFRVTSELWPQATSRRFFLYDTGTPKSHVVAAIEERLAGGYRIQPQTKAFDRKCSAPPYLTECWSQIGQKFPSWEIQPWQFLVSCLQRCARFSWQGLKLRGLQGETTRSWRDQFGPRGRSGVASHFKGNAITIAFASLQGEPRVIDTWTTHFQATARLIAKDSGPFAVTFRWKMFQRFWSTATLESKVMVPGRFLPSASPGLAQKDVII